MPSDHIGQKITFATEIDPHLQTRESWIAVHKNDTCQKIAGRRGHPEQAQTIATLNGIRSVTQRLSEGKRIRVPASLDQKASFDVHAGDTPPNITDGYAMFQTIARPGGLGINKFDGYNPVAMTVPIRFEGVILTDSESGQGITNLLTEQARTGYGNLVIPTVSAGAAIEAAITKLERMAGRGGYPGATVGPPAVIRLSTTNNAGQLVALLPPNYQWTPAATNAPLWRITGIAWDDQTALRDDQGNRIRQLAVVTVTQYTPIVAATRSAAQRAAA